MGIEPVTPDVSAERSFGITDDLALLIDNLQPHSALELFDLLITKVPSVLWVIDRQVQGAVAADVGQMTHPVVGGIVLSQIERRHGDGVTRHIDYRHPKDPGAPRQVCELTVA